MNKFNPLNVCVVNRELIKVLGADAAIMLSELCTQLQDEISYAGLSEDSYFSCSVKYIEDEYGLSDYKQREILNKLKKLGIVDYKNQGLPPKRYIRIFQDAVSKLFPV